VQTDKPPNPQWINKPLQLQGSTSQRHCNFNGLDEKPT